MFLKYIFFFYMALVLLTTIGLCVSKLNSDEVLHPERVTDAASSEGVTVAVAGAVQLTD